MIRKYRPEIVFANAIDDRHPDHAKGAKLVSDACFLSGLRKIETVLEGKFRKRGDQSIFLTICNGKM
jgi:LmbE family N-acetylglucosaminyl deacetylase